MALLVYSGFREGYIYTIESKHPKIGALVAQKREYMLLVTNEISSEIIRSMNISLNILNAEHVWTSECSLWKKLVNKNTSEKCVE